mmetsp:Transcript_20550/g.28834  ORF Transcript_20550/g.28834 Transcript_20550/m.28834 type:complete len:264 (-) Transcript_20550:51-842(-)
MPIDPYIGNVDFLFRDNNPYTAKWAMKVFQNAPEQYLMEQKYATHVASKFKVAQGDIFSCSVDCIISGGNSFGFMEGGLDGVCRERFGNDLMSRLQQQIQSPKHNGELLIGEAILLETKDTSSNPIKYFVSAPVMRSFSISTGSLNAYFAFRGALLAIRKHNKKITKKLKSGTLIKSVACTGLGTASGKMSGLTSVSQMVRAYENVVLGRVFPHEAFYPYAHEEHLMRQDFGQIPTLEDIPIRLEEELVVLPTPISQQYGLQS